MALVEGFLYEQMGQRYKCTHSSGESAASPLLPASASPCFRELLSPRPLLLLPEQGSQEDVAAESEGQL